MPSAKVLAPATLLLATLLGGCRAADTRPPRLAATNGSQPAAMASAPAQPSGLQVVPVAHALRRPPRQPPEQDNRGPALSDQVEPLPDPDRSQPRAPRRAMERLRIPEELPGAEAQELYLGPAESPDPTIRLRAVAKLFPELPLVPPLSLPVEQPGQLPLSLPELRDLGLRNNPILTQANADVTVFMGAAIQEGTHPNPTVGYEADTVGSSRTRNYHGMYFTQTIKTAGKLGLQRAVANMDLMNSQLAVRKARYNLIAEITAGYYGVLVAQEGVIVNDALVRFTNEVYRIQVDKVREEAAGYEPAQLRTLAVQARSALVQSNNRYVSAWKQLAASLGLPEMPPTYLAGSVDMPAPVVRFEPALNRLLSSHPDVLAARNLESQARLQLRLESIKPIPDTNVYAAIQRDFTTSNLPLTTYNLQVGIPLPVFDRNRGNIITAQGNLVKASQQLRRVRNELSAELADAFERFETNRVQLQLYRDQILPDLARAYRGVYDRHQGEPDKVGFGEIIVAQQNLANAVAVYVTTLNSQWRAVADLLNLLQAEDPAELQAISRELLPPANVEGTPNQNGANPFGADQGEGR